MKPITIEGSPTEVGGQIWDHYCSPAVHAATDRPERKQRGRMETIHEREIIGDKHD